MTLEYEWVKTIDELVKQIAECEGRHTQQAIFSTFHGALTTVIETTRRETIREAIKITTKHKESIKIHGELLGLLGKYLTESEK